MLSIVVVCFSGHVFKCGFLAWLSYVVYLIFYFFDRRKLNSICIYVKSFFAE